MLLLLRKHKKRIAVCFLVAVWIFIVTIKSSSQEASDENLHTHRTVEDYDVQDDLEPTHGEGQKAKDVGKGSVIFDSDETLQKNVENDAHNNVTNNDVTDEPEEDNEPETVKPDPVGGPVSLKVRAKMNSVMRQFENLCVVDVHSGPYYIRNKHPQPTSCRVRRKALVIYNSKPCTHRPPAMDPVHCVRDKIPKSFKLNDSIAIITYARYLNNFNHFWREFMFPMLSLKWRSEVKGGKKPLLLFNRPPIDYCNINRTSDPPRRHWVFMDNFLSMLDVDVIPDPYEWHMFHSLPHGSCFKTAVVVNPLYFGHSQSGLSNRIRRGMMRQLNITSSECEKAGIVTLISRKGDRQIINEYALQKVAMAAGYDMRVVSMEKLSMRQQALQVYCSKVIIGVQGAGLQWTMLLRPGSALIEVAWPNHGWPFRFSTPEMKGMWPGVKTLQLRAAKNYHNTTRDSISPGNRPFLVTKDRNISEVSRLILDMSGHRHGNIQVDVAKLLEFVQHSNQLPGVLPLVSALTSTLKKHKTLGLGALNSIIRRKVDHHGNRILVAIEDALKKMNNFGKGHQAYLNPNSFISVLKSAFK